MTDLAMLVGGLVLAAILFWQVSRTWGNPTG